jgi:anthranilate synthase/aminodeoxychorismate synthase-like glutamine amidotransferase
MILIDNYDSFTYNIVQYLRELGVEPRVFKNDEITPKELKKMDFERIIISPGPNNPNGAGVSLDVVKEFYKTKKILGICLGHQCIAQFFGGKIIKDKNPTHGKTSKIIFTPEARLFKGIEQNFLATRYHSLTVDKDKLPKCLIPVAFSEDGVLMGIEHELYNVYGVQFHPEAILTQFGKVLLKNFIKLD